MRQFCVNVLHSRSQASPEALAKAVLAEVPGQLTGLFLADFDQFF